VFLHVNKTKGKPNETQLREDFIPKSPVDSPICSCSNRRRVSENGSTGMPCWAWQGRTGCCGSKKG
jgi:hypothetical protein